MDKKLKPKVELKLEKKCPCCEALSHETFYPEYGYSFERIHRDLVFVHGKTRMFQMTERYIDEHFEIVEKE